MTLSIFNEWTLTINVRIFVQIKGFETSVTYCLLSGAVSPNYIELIYLMTTSGQKAMYISAGNRIKCPPFVSCTWLRVIRTVRSRSGRTGVKDCSIRTTRCIECVQLLGWEAASGHCPEQATARIWQLSLIRMVLSCW